MQKTSAGRFFEDFAVGDVLAHATPRTITSGDVAVYQGIYGSRFAVQSSAPFARALGYRDAPVDDLIVFHIVFGKSVPDVSINAVANLGYAECRFLRPVYVGDTLSARSKVIGVRENSNGKTGVVYVRTTGTAQDGAAVLEFVRWVMVRKRDAGAAAPEPVVPELADAIDPASGSIAVPSFGAAAYDFEAAGAPFRASDYEIGEKIEHVDGITVEEAEHQIATRLYQNTAKVHFDALAQKDSRFGRRLIYGGVVISLARALSFNGLQNAFHIAGINGGRHVLPLFAGDTVYAWSEVVDRQSPEHRSDIAVVRLRTVATKDQPCGDFPDPAGDDEAAKSVILDLDYWVAMPA
ncbi:MAG: MaoC family dehydratase [Pseudomonadota bacterium]